MRKNIVLTLVLIIASVISFSQSSILKTESFTATLENTASFSKCGAMMYSYALKFTTINIKSSFLGIVTCPEGYGKLFFIKGDKYLITARKITSPNNVSSNSIIFNPFENEKLPTYSIINIRRLR